MAHNCKNYKDNNGDRLVIGGTIVIDEDATIVGLPQGVAVADATGTSPTKAEFNALLTSLRGAGIIATASE